jgi:hypothetical protein
LPFDQTASGLTTHFSGDFCTQIASAGLSQFSGKYLHPILPGPLVMTFSRPVTNISVGFATVDYQNPMETPSTIQLSAFRVSAGETNFVGTTSMHAEYGSDNYPMGTLRFGSGQPFNRVHVVVPPQPPSQQRFLADNIVVSLAPPPATNVAPVLAAISNWTVTAGTPVSFTAAATDDNWPAQTLTFSLESGHPSGANITPGGLFTWTPTPAQAPSTNVILVRVTDDGTPPRSDTKSFTVVVNAPIRPTLSICCRSNTVAIVWPASSVGYELQETSNLVPANWTNTANAVAVIGDQNEVVVPFPTNGCFYRLLYP